MRRGLLSAALLCGTAFVTPALAADVIYEEPMAPAPAPVVVFEPAFTWTGFYVGGQAGVAFNTDSGSFSSDDSSFVGGSDDDEDAGFIGGVHVGYDHQIDNFIIGAVADINYIDAESNTSYTLDGFDGSAEFGVNSDINFVGTLRAKAGFAADRFAIYATGGLAYADLDEEHNGGSTFTSVGGTLYNVSVDQDSDDIGYAVGGGVDYLVTQNFSIGVEYLYTDLGESDASVNYTAVGTPFGTDLASFDADSSRDLDFHTVWAKASFRFN